MQFRVLKAGERCRPNLRTKQSLDVQIIAEALEQLGEYSGLLGAYENLWGDQWECRTR